MTRMKKTLLALSVLVILAIAGSAMQKAQPAASTPTIAGIPVTIASPLPVPVSGTVSAQQIGTWNVGINGTPSVNIANSPTVNVASSATAPFFFRNVDDPGRIPYQSTAGFSNASDCYKTTQGYYCAINFTPNYPNHRLIIQHVSGLLHFGNGVPGAANPTGFVNPGPTGGLGVAHGFPVPPISAGAADLAFDQLVQVYLDAGPAASVYVFVQDFSTAGDVPSDGTIALTGYLLDCSTAPCAAIAQ